jgi:hypothetical protein
MKKIYTALFSLFLFASQAQTPDWAWARTAGSDDLDEATSIAADATGNIYATGYFSGPSFVVGSTTLTNGSAGSKQFFITKYSRTGQVIWASAAGGNDDDEGTSIAVDGTGNIYVCGNYESPTITFGSSVLTNSSNPGQGDIFLVKYNSAGTVQWAKSIGGGLQDDANGVAADASGNVCLTGSYSSLSLLFGNFGVVNSGLTDAFVAKYNSSGVALWAKNIGGGQIDNGNDVAIDNNGNVYVTGDYNSTTIPTYSPSLTNAGGFDVFFAKYDASGSIIYGLKFGGSGNESSTSIYAQGNGEYFICGYFESASLVFGSTTLNNAVTRSMFLTKFNTAGAPQWAQKANGSQNGFPRDLAGDAANIYMTGAFDQSSVTFGSSALSNGGSLDAFVVKYDMSNGSVLWAKNSAASALDQSNAVAIGAGFVHIAGMYTATLTLRDNTLNADGASDAFLTKLCFAPAAPVSASGSTVCFGYPSTLNATTPAGTNPVWFASASGGNSLHVGSTYNAAGGGTFYVASRDTNSGCGMYSSSRIAAYATIYPPVNPSVSVSGHTLFAGGNGNVAAWYDCNATATLSGQTSQSYVLTQSGYYAVIMVSAQGCRDTSACNNYSYTPGSGTVIVTPGVQENTRAVFRLSAFPNPSNGYFIVRSSGSTKIQIVNTLGMTVQKFTLDEKDQNEVSVGPLPPGVYFVVPEERKGIVRVVVTN